MSIWKYNRGQKEEATSRDQPVTSKDYASVASLIEGRERVQQIHKTACLSPALRNVGELYKNREYVAAYELFKPICDKVVADTQRILARNVEFEGYRAILSVKVPE